MQQDFTKDAQYKLEAIPIAFDRHGMTFSKTASAQLVGGKARLGKLIESGEIRVKKLRPGAQNGKWHCVAGDVIRHIKL